MLKVGQVKEIYEMKGAGRSIRGIADDLGVARNTVRRYLKSPEAMRPKLRARRASKLDAYTEYVDRRMSEGLENCVVLHRELKALGHDGGYSILKSYVSPRRRRRQPRCVSRRRQGSRLRLTEAAWHISNRCTVFNWSNIRDVRVVSSV